MTIHIDEVEFYLEHVDPNGTAEEVARWMRVKKASLSSAVRNRHPELAERLARNAEARGFNVTSRKAAA